MTMQFDYKETKININGKEYKVCIPEYKFSNLHVNVRNPKLKDTIIFSSKEDVMILALAFYHFHNRESAILYIPAPRNMPTFLDKDLNSTEVCYDLVLLNHKMQFNHKDWKEVRSKLKKLQFIAKMQKIDVRLLESIEYHDYSYRENKDYLDLFANYNTLFLSGSDRVFLNLSENSYDLAISQCPLENGSHVHFFNIIRGGQKGRCIEKDLIIHLFDPNWK